MSRKILKKSKERVETSPFQFQASQFSENPLDLEAEAELDAFEAPSTTNRYSSFQNSAPQVDMADLINRAQEDAEALISDARQRASAVERDAYEKGLEEGRKTGEIMAEQQLQVVLTQYHQSLTALDQMRDLMINQNQLEIMELVVHIAQKVIHAELGQNPAAILPMIKHGLNSLKQRKELTIYLNSDDHEFVQSMADAERQKWVGTQAQIELDTALGRGSFRIETAAGELDANIEAQLLQVQENLASSIEI